MSCGRGCRSSLTPSARAVTRATPSRAASRPIPRRRRRLPPGISACALLSVAARRPGGRSTRAEPEYSAVASAQLADIAGDSGPDRAAHALGVDGQRQVFAGDGAQYRLLPELDRERQAIQLARKTGIEV